ncbi:response regulator [Cohnella yongneupensis]|uniref:Response regulator n=1 Tax=Cohnella yongneupensis TaxID=425006 RepID=A0ABW0R5L3_9BACL
MKAIIVDDEYLALESMTRLLQRFEVNVAGAFQDPREALKQQQSLNADVAFVDIEMPELNGLELAARMQAAQPGLQIVFVTAYEQYAIEAFELAAIDYLLKPIQLKRLDLTIKRLQARRADPTPEPEQAAAPMVCFFHHLSFQDAQGHPLTVAWRTAKARELLAYLIHSGDKTPSKEELLDRIWPDADPDKSITHLHTTVYQIRQSMKAMGIPLRLQYKEGRYHIDQCGTQVDVLAWEKAVREAAEAGDDGAMNRLLMSSYRGDYLETEDYMWADGERERLRALWLDHALKNASRLEATGASSDALSLYQQLQVRYPENEESYFGLMRLYGKLGNNAEVHQQYAKLTDMLSEDYGVEPSESIMQWFAQWNERKQG